MPAPTTRDSVAIVGVGYTKPTRTPEKSEVELGVEACRLAAEDAGFDPSEIDGISIQVHHYPPPETSAIAKGLGMKEIKWSREHGAPGIGSTGMGVEAIESGQCKALVICKIMNTVAPVTTPEIDPEAGGVPGVAQFEVPYGLGYTMQRVGLYSRYYMHRYGISERQIGWVAMVERDHAIEHPYAYQKKAITMDDYLASRWIAEPVRLLDCDIPINGAFAYLMIRGDIAKTLRHPPIWVMGWAETPEAVFGGRDGFFMHHLLSVPEGLSPAAAALYRDSKLSPKDMDIAYPYDGFSFFVPMWLANLGILKPGEAGDFVDGGERIRRTGELPVNTHGGNLAGGRMHGQGHVMEAVEQLRGTAGPRQITKRMNYAVLSAGFPFVGNTGILARER